MSVRIIDINKSYGNQKVLNGISFDVQEGEIVGLLGPNGAGKSTLMKIITGYLSPDSGDVDVCGISVLQNADKVQKLIGYLPEHNPLYTDMYVREYLSMTAGLYGIENEKRKIEELITLTGLTSECHKKIGALSKGYRQRVGLAQALISDPQVVILDEPTTGLDPNQIVEIRDVIKQVGKRCTVILSTHIMQEVEAVCDRVVILDRGELKVDGTVDEIGRIANRGMIVEVEFQNSVNLSDFKASLDAVEIIEVGDNRYRIEGNENIDVRPQIFNFAVSAKNILLEMSELESDMESVFHKITS